MLVVQLWKKLRQEDDLNIGIFYKLSNIARAYLRNAKVE